jgi:serine/threonine protein kinase
MPLPTFMQKGLTVLLKVVKLAGREGTLKLLDTLEKHFTLTAYEIAQAYQDSYEAALEAISIGLGKPALLASSVIKEFATQIMPNYVQPFVQGDLARQVQIQQFCAEAMTKCQTLVQYKQLLFKGDNSQLTESELAALVTDTGSLSITNLVIEQLSRSAIARSQLDEKLVAFLSFNDLLGTAILFFLHEQLRREPRVETTLATLQRQGLWQDVQDLKNSLHQLMLRLDLSTQIKPRDEFTHHNRDSLQQIQEAVCKLKQLSYNNPQYSQLVILGGSVLSSTGALQEAENLFLQARDTAQTDTERALVAFNLFQLRIRERAFEPALTALREAIQIDRSRYALHDIEKYPMVRILGVGGMSCVFLCTHKLRKQSVVVKCFWENRQGRAEEVFQEAFAMSNIAGEYVPAPLDYGYVDAVKQTRAFFVTEYIDGAIDGESWLVQSGKFQLETGLQVALQVAKGLQIAHTAGILHLDLKPANLLFKKEPTTAISVKIIDFGLSQVTTPLQQQLVTRFPPTQLSTFGQAVFGTLDYAPPEQQGFVDKYGKPSPKSDIFAFGATLYRLFTNDSPRKLNPKRLAESPELFELLCDCMEEEPARRPSLQEIILKLENLSPQIKHRENILLKNKDEPSAAEENDELQQLLELARTKYERSHSSYSSYFQFDSSVAIMANNDIYVICPNCDKIFTVMDEGGAKCPYCSGEFEIDEDGDVIYEYENDEDLETEAIEVEDESILGRSAADSGNN